MATELTANETGIANVRGTTDGAGDVIEIQVENVSEGSNGDGGSSAIQFNNFQGFNADPDTDEFTLSQINVQDADDDDDDDGLDRVEYVVTDGSGTQVGSTTVDNIGPAQYQAQSPAITIAASEDVQRGRSYTITATVYDADGNSNSRTLPDSVPTASSVVSNNDDGSLFNSQSSAVQFSVSNTGTDSVQVSVTSVSSSGSNAQVLKEQSGGSGPDQREIFISSPTDSSYYEAGDGGNDDYALGSSVSLANPASIASGDDGTISLYRFNSGGSGNSGNPVDMQGETVDVTLEFSDGSSTTLQVNVPN